MGRGLQRPLELDDQDRLAVLARHGSPIPQEIHWVQLDAIRSPVGRKQEWNAEQAATNHLVIDLYSQGSTVRANLPPKKLASPVIRISAPKPRTGTPRIERRARSAEHEARTGICQA